MAKKPKRGSEKSAARARTARRLDALYATLPKLECKGLCAHSCIPITVAPEERNRIRREHGVELPEADELFAQGCTTCVALQDGRCSVYDARPMICRLWGIDETMRCPHGCIPEGGWLPLLESHRLTLKTYLIAGWPAAMEPMTPQQVANHLRSDETREFLEQARDRIFAEEQAKKQKRRFARWGRRSRTR